MVKRVLVAILAVLLLIMGGVLGAAAIWANSAFDENGVMRTDAGTIDPGANARSTIIDIDRFEASVPYIGELGTTRLTVMTGEGSDPSNTLFFGAAATSDVDTFVKGSAYAVGIRDGSEWVTREIPGALIPPLPRDQQFWLAQDVGRNPGIVVPSDRPLTLLVMHPSGVPSGPLTLSLDFAIPQIAKWVLGMAIAAVVLIIIAIILIIVVIRMRGRRGRHEGDVVVAAAAPVVVESAPVVEAVPVVEPAPVVEAAKPETEEPVAPEEPFVEEPVADTLFDAEPAPEPEPASQPVAAPDLMPTEEIAEGADPPAAEKHD